MIMMLLSAALLDVSGPSAAGIMTWDEESGTSPKSFGMEPSFSHFTGGNWTCNKVRTSHHRFESASPRILRSACSKEGGGSFLLVKKVSTQFLRHSTYLRFQRRKRSTRINLCGTSQVKRRKVIFRRIVNPPKPSKRELKVSRSTPSSGRRSGLTLGCGD